MGSYNVACSVSNISISSGTKIAFIPLLPAEMNETIGRKYNHFKLKPGYVFLEPSSNWVSNEGAYQFYKPFSLPIIGYYNDYGGIESIEENITSKVISEYFGISIEEFVDCIGSQRDDYDYFSSVFNSYFSIDKKLLSEYSVKFDENWMVNIGFTKLEDGTFQYKGQSFYVSLHSVEANKDRHRQAGFGYEILSAKDKKSLKKNSDTYDIRKKFLQEYLEVSGYRIGYKEEAQEKIKFLKKLSGMFVHYDIYEFMAKNTFSEYSMKLNAGSWLVDADLNEDSLRKLGFKFRCKDETIERYNKVYEYPGVTNYVVHSDGTWSHISKTSEKHPNGSKREQGNGTYHPNSMIHEWKRLTGVEIKVDESIALESKYGASFDQIREQYLEYLKEDEDDEEVKKINEEKLKKAELLKSNPEELKKEIEKLKADKARFEIFKAISALKFSDEDDDDIDDSDDDVDVEDLENIEMSDEKIGKELIKRLEERYKPIKSFRHPLNEPAGHIYLHLKPRYDKYNMLITLYEPFVKDGSIRQDILDFCNFNDGVNAVNKVYMPAYNSYQCGCYPATYYLAKKTMEISQECIRNFQEEEEEEEA